MKKIDVYTLGVREKFEGWIRDRGGVKVWRNIDLSNTGAGAMFTPALTEEDEPYPKPSWRVDDGEVYTDLSQFRFVKGFKEFKRIKVRLRLGAQGFKVKLADTSQRSLDRALARAREQYGECTWRPEGLADPCVVVEIPEWEDA